MCDARATWSKMLPNGAARERVRTGLPGCSRLPHSENPICTEEQQDQHPTQRQRVVRQTIDLTASISWSASIASRRLSSSEVSLLLRQDSSFGAIPPRSE